MRYFKLLVASVMLVSISACVADSESDLEGYIKTINIIGPDEIAFEQTKATFVDNGSALVFRWAAGDTLGIFPNKGNQVEFPITTQESSTSASFDGGGWALRNNASYAAYYPFSVWNYFQNNKTVIMDYSGQVQDGNGSFAHLSAYDYLASAKTTPENGSVTFQMDRQGAILYIDIVVPEPATITSLTISCDEAIFVEKAALDISGNNPVVSPVETKESLTLTFENTTTTEQNETVRAYMAVQPVDFSSKTVTATLVTDAGTYTAPVVSRVVNKGKAAFLRFSDSFNERPIPEAVDLGLPSGLKWASFNVGASAPEEYGDYYAWGETEPYYSSLDPLTWRANKTGYNWASYKFELGSNYNGPFFKYVTNSSYGTVDNNTVLDPEDDAAVANWGDSWRMPTIEEWQELLDECTWTWTTQNGVSGRLVTSNTNDNSIFLPAAGFRDDTYLYNAGFSGSYRSSSLYTYGPHSACSVYFYSGSCDWSSNGRGSGQSVRAVSDEGVRISVTGVSLNKDNLDLDEGESESLTATVTPTNATQPTVIWSSSDNTVATVDYTGKVTAVASGTATITAKAYDGGFTATCTVTVNSSSPAFVPEAVDLGLPSGLKWASCNVGATAPEDYGDYYAWGETEAKEEYIWDTYKWCNGTEDSMIKYCYDSQYGFNGFSDNRTVLLPEDDVATAKWGNNWRIPTETEAYELMHHTTLSVVEYNGVNVFEVKSEINGNAIYFPIAGYREGSGIYDANTYRGYYWCSNLDGLRTYDGSNLCLSINSVTGNMHVSYGYYTWSHRYIGYSVRPVYGASASTTVLGDIEGTEEDKWN